MNNNRGNNRRRGRGNNNRQQGGGQQLNRIDSRARGNAPQLLEKYRKLAHDAHLNGDRVTEEYNLQFADHYFRVIADSRARQDETRQPRQDRWQDGEGGDRYDNDGAGEYGADNDYPSSPYNYGEQRQRDDSPRDDRPRDDRETSAPEQRREPRPPREPRAERRPEPAPQPVAEEPAATGEDTGANEGQPSLYEPSENPFIRDSRGQRGLKPRRPRRDAAETAGGEQAPGFDLAALPPSISPREEAAAASEAAEPEAEAKPKRRAPRKPKPSADDAGEQLKEAS